MVSATFKWINQGLSRDRPRLISYFSYIPPLMCELYIIISNYYRLLYRK
ncbi:hypothetical protein VP489E541_P0053 [Vibrio phage 489E54-1]|nr:hypothetical protein VP489E541_P0053 [Vibrio phage 489E54-1]